MVVKSKPNGSEIETKIETVLGEQLFERLAAVFGGTTIYLSENPGDSHPWLQVLTRLEYDLVLDAIGPGRITLPKLSGRQREYMASRAIEMRENGCTIREIAQALNVHERTVYRMLRRG